MDIQQTADELQTFSDANGLNIDAHAVLNIMDAGDFIEINTAMDKSDNRSIMKILQKYKARVSESYVYFNGDALIESNSMKFISDMGISELTENYHQFVTGALTDSSHLTISEIKTLVFEDITTSLNANQIASRNNSVQQNQVNPQTQLKMKQADIQRNSNNKNYKVSVPGNQNGVTDVENVVGIDSGPTPQTTLVVTKDNTKPNEINVFGLDDIQPIANGTQVSEDNEENYNQNDVMAPPDVDQLEQSQSPLTDTPPNFGELVQQIGDITDGDDIHGDDSPMGNSEMAEQDEIIKQIMDFCTRLQGR